MNPKLGKKGTFRRQVQEWRQRCGQSQPAAAKTLGVTVDTLQNWEQGRNEPSRLLQNLLKPRLADCAFSEKTDA